MYSFYNELIICNSLSLVYTFKVELKVELGRLTQVLTQQQEGYWECWGSLTKVDRNSLGFITDIK